MSDAVFNAFHFHPSGEVTSLEWSEARSIGPDEGWIWLDLDRTKPETARWLRNHSGIDPLACEALLAEETRPRTVSFGNDALVVILRGVNLNPGAEPDDMIALRIWIEGRRVITLRAFRFFAIQDLVESIEKQTGPATPGDFIVKLNSKLVDRIGDVTLQNDEAVDQLEVAVVDEPTRQLRTRLGVVRRQAIGLRRFLAPQRDALSRLQTENVPWLTDIDRARLREVADRLTRFVEDLDAVRERAAVTQEQLAGIIAEQMERTTYALTVVAGIFLPLGFITGLLGINVGGMPGVNNGWAFTVVCIGLGLIATGSVWIFRRMRFF